MECSRTHHPGPEREQRRRCVYIRRLRTEHDAAAERPARLLDDDYPSAAAAAAVVVDDDANVNAGAVPLRARPRARTAPANVTSWPRLLESCGGGSVWPRRLVRGSGEARSLPVYISELY